VLVQPSEGVVTGGTQKSGSSSFFGQ